MNRFLAISMGYLFFAGISSAAVAASDQPTIEGAKECTKNLARYERQYGVPMHLLSAISATESGRYHEGLKITLPWPWTINAAGQGYYFDTKAEAIAKVNSLLASGVRSIDVGCMQVNLLHHPEAFANLEDAFDPNKNVAYGASFLRSLFEETKSWKQAAAAYHSKTPSRGTEYVDRVYDRWSNIISRLRKGNEEIPETTMAALNETVSEADPVVLTRPNGEVPLKSMPLPPRSNMRMKTIEVSNREPVRERDQGVLVIRPKITVVDDVQEVASNSMPSDSMVIARAEPVSISSAMPKVIHVAQTQPALSSNSTSNGPRFIFEN